MRGKRSLIERRPAVHSNIHHFTLSHHPIVSVFSSDIHSVKEWEKKRIFMLLLLALVLLLLLCYIPLKSTRELTTTALCQSWISLTSFLPKLFWALSVLLFCLHLQFVYIFKCSPSDEWNSWTFLTQFSSPFYILLYSDSESLTFSPFSDDQINFSVKKLFFI